MTDEVDLTGAVDLHTHVGPSMFGRRVDGYECAAEAAEAGMDAVVMKEHHLPTAYGKAYIDRLLERDGVDIDVFGSLVCNYSNGGFNPFAVETAIGYGAKVIWGPTIDAKHHADVSGDLGGFLDVEAGEEYDDVEGVTALSDGTLREDVKRCIEKTATHDVVLALGHLSYRETKAMVEYAADLGHERIVIDHPNYEITGLDHDQQRELAELGATLNFPFLGISEAYGWTTGTDLAANIRAVGVDNCIVSSDGGQAKSPSAPAGLRTLGEALFAQGISESEFEAMVERRPKELLGLE
jgi:hypothetical protein